MSLSKQSISEPVGLADRLRDRIKREGPITFRDWMDAALYDPEQGYYCRADLQRWGRAGDYRTSPERSPLFAATFARYFANLFEAMNRPARWTIVECGAGSGIFAEGVLVALRLRFPEAFAALKYIVIEVSEHSSAAAQTKLAGFAERMEFRSLDEISEIDHCVVFSNELLDAFAVHRVTNRGGELRELYVALDPSDQFAWTVGPLSNPELAEYFEFVNVQLIEGQTTELNLASAVWLKTVASKLRNGYVVTVDYGAEASELYGMPERRLGTLRGFRHHQLVEDVLATPGEQDITTTVDWTFIKRVGENLGLGTIDFQAQHEFLMGNGLLEELEQMVAETDDVGLKLQLRTGAREMILPPGMAASFQVFIQQRVDGR
jgi:SAM-dependent MidA family methyltransferase